VVGCSRSESRPGLQEGPPGLEKSVRHGILGDTEVVSDGGVGQPVDVLEDQDLTVLRGDLGEGPEERLLR